MIQPKKPFLYSFLRIIIGAWLVFSGLAKLFDFNSFIIILAEQGIIPPVFYSPFAIMLIVFELILGLVLILGILELFTDISTVSVFTVFIIFHIILYMKDKELSCGCYGTILDSYISNEMSIVLTFFFWIIAIFILLLHLQIRFEQKNKIRYIIRD